MDIFKGFYIVTTTERRACEWMFFELGKPRKEIDRAQFVERRETHFVEGTLCYHKVTLWYKMIPQHTARWEIKWIAPHPFMPPGRALRYGIFPTKSLCGTHGFLHPARWEIQARAGISQSHCQGLQVHHKVHPERRARTILRKIRYRYKGCVGSLRYRY
jgi:hypothetical protein